MKMMEHKPVSVSGRVYRPPLASLFPFASPLITKTRLKSERSSYQSRRKKINTMGVIYQQTPPRCLHLWLRSNGCAPFLLCFVLLFFLIPRPYAQLPPSTPVYRVMRFVCLNYSLKFGCTKSFMFISSVRSGPAVLFTFWYLKKIK